jgi:hypothetical protein
VAQARRWSVRRAEDVFRDVRGARAWMGRGHGLMAQWAGVAGWGWGGWSHAVAGACFTVVGVDAHTTYI